MSKPFFTAKRIAFVRRRHDSGHRPRRPREIRIILLDIGLPGGDGFLLLGRFRANTHTRHIPIVVTTGQTTSGPDAKAKSKGATAYMQKPINKEILLDTLAQVLRESECT